MIKITGYKIREELKKTNLRIDMLESEFDDSKTGFKDDDKRPMDEITNDLFRAEEKACALQEANQRYNLNVKTNLPPFGEVTLARIIKLVGPVSRIEKKWRRMAAPKKDRRRYFHDDHEVREADKEYSENRYTREEAGEQAKIWAERLASLRSTLATLNAQEIEMNIPPSLFE